MRLLALAMLAAAPTRAGEPEFWREGPELSLMLGAAGGTQNPTLRLPGLLIAPEAGSGFAFGARFAYRPIPWVGPWFDVGLGMPSGGRVFAGGFGIAAYPVHFWRIDPFIDLGSTYTQWKGVQDLTSEGQTFEVATTLHGAAFHLGIGVPVFVLPWLAVGPSFRYELAFWQSACFDAPGYDNCEEVGDLDDADPDFPDTLPNLWRAGVDVVFHPSRPRP